MTAPDPSDAEFAARLIRAGMRETPAPVTLQRTLAGLGLGAGALGTASSAGALAATKASVTALALVKWAGIGACAGTLLAAGAHGVYRATRPAALSSNPAMTVRESPGAAMLVARETPSELPASSSSSVLVVGPAPPRATPPAPATADVADTEAPLAAELAFVDRGREAFQRGDPAAALVRLQGYERSFPKGRLLPEVLYLRMQALRQRGEIRGAAELAARLVRDFPKSPHASSARGVLAGDAAR